MYAIVEIAGQQFKVEAGNEIFVQRLADAKGADVEFKKVLLVADDADFKSIGTSGCMKKGKSVQIIIGLKVPKVRDEFEKLM